MKHPRVDEWTAGIERALDEGRPPLRHRHLAPGQEHPGARSTPTRAGRPTHGRPNGLTGQPLTVYNWANRAASENERRSSPTPTASSTSTRTATCSARPSTERKYKGADVRARQALHQPLAGARLVRAVEDRGLPSTTPASNTYGQRALFETPTHALVNTLRHARSTTARTRSRSSRTWQIPKIEVNLNGYYRYLSGTTYTPYQRFALERHQLPDVRRAASRSSSRAAAGGSTTRATSTCASRRSSSSGGLDRLVGLRRHPERLQRGHGRRGQRRATRTISIGRLRRADRVRGADRRSSSRAGSSSARAGASSAPGDCRAVTARERDGPGGRRPPGPFLLASVRRLGAVSPVGPAVVRVRRGRGAPCVGAPSSAARPLGLPVRRPSIPAR